MDVSPFTGQPLVNRYAIDQLPAEVARLAAWIRANAETVSDTHVSEWPEEERLRLLPGVELMRELAEGELAEAQSNFDALCQFVGSPPRDALDRQPSRYRHIFQVEHEQVYWREQIRATLRGYLREVVDIARDARVPESELHELLNDVLQGTGPGADDKNVITLADVLARRRRSSTPGE